MGGPRGAQIAMSLKARLTFLHLSILGGFLLLFSVTVYLLLGVTLIAQVDKTLERSATDLISITRANASGVLESVTNISLGSNVFAQIWGFDGKLKASSGGISGFRQPLDALTYQTTAPVFRDVTLGTFHMRVLSLPLEVEHRPFGVLQVATDMAVVDGAQRELSYTLVVVSVVALVVAGIVGWVSVQNTLAPLEAVTEAALQITETRDLSRRVPLQGPAKDEVGQLVQAFNLNLSRLERLIDTQRRFLADVGHELRTPLTVIKGNVGLMRRIGELDEESLTGIEEEVERLSRLVGDLLLLAQAEAGKLPMYRQIVDLDTVLLEVFRQAKVLAKDQLTLKIGTIDQVLVCGDRDRLKQVLLNLISNSVKYTPRGGQVLVSLDKVGNQAHFTVNDTGPGIPEEDLPHIFERFYRAEKSRVRSKDGKGFGLGLSIAYWIVANHQGRIEVQSKLGEGTTFIVWLPLAEGDCQGEAETAA